MDPGNVTAESVVISEGAVGAVGAVVRQVVGTTKETMAMAVRMLKLKPAGKTLALTLARVAANATC